MNVLFPGNYFVLQFEIGLKCLPNNKSPLLQIQSPNWPVLRFLGDSFLSLDCVNPLSWYNSRLFPSFFLKHFPQRLCLFWFVWKNRKYANQTSEKNKNKAFIITSLKFMFSKKATKIDEIFTIYFNLNQRQIDGEDFVNSCGLLRKHDLYMHNVWVKKT